MRFLTGTILLLSAVLCLVLGGLTLASAMYKKIEAQAEVGDLSAVSSDLVDEDQLAKMRQDADALIAESKKGKARAKQLALGGTLVVCGLLQLLAGVLSTLRRGRRLSLIVIGASMLALVATMLWDSATLWAGVCLGLLLFAAVTLGLPARQR